MFAPVNIYNESAGFDSGPPANFHNDQDWVILATDQAPLADWIDDTGNFPGLCTGAGNPATVKHD